MLRVSICIAIITATPLLAQDNFDDLDWEGYRYEPFEPSDLGLGLRFGLPESDFVLMRANCMSPGGGTGPSNIRGAFTADLGAAVEGQSILVEFEGLTGGLPVVTGRASGVGAEIGITGVVIESPSDDRLWQHLGASESFRYRVRGQDDWIVYPADPAQFSAFVAECRALGGQSEPSEGPLPPAIFDPATQIADCSDEPLARSTQMGEEIDVTVTNAATEVRVIYWLDENGARVERGRVPPGRSATLGTLQSHVWLIADEAGTCLEIRASTFGDFTIGDAPRADTK